MTTRAGEVRPPAEARVEVLALVTLAAAVGLWLLVGRHATPQDGPLVLPWWALLPMVVAAQASVVSFQVRRQAQGISLCHLPLVLGLLCSTPAAFVLSRAVGGAMAMAAVRRQRGLKLRLNTAAYCLEAVAAVSLLHALGDLPAPVAVCLVMVVSDLTSFSVVRAAISITEGRVDLQAWLRPVTWLLPVNLLATSCGLLAVAALWRGGGYLLLLGAVASAVLVVYRTYDRLRTQHVDLGRLQELAVSLPSLVPGGADLRDVLEQTRLLLVADRAELGFSDGLLVQAHHDPAVAALQAPIADDPPSPAAGRRWPRAAHRTLRTVLTFDDGRQQATLSVKDRFGGVRPFDDGDARLLAAAGALLGSGLDRGLQRQRLLDAALRDPLTDLWNLPEASRRATASLRTGQAQGLVVFDVIGLQDVNDSLGHEAGDALLKLTAERLSRTAGPGAITARVGGDEFLAVLSGASPAPEDLARRIGGTVDVAGTRLELRVRAGFCRAADSAASFDRLLGNARAALARAAGAGNRYGTWRAELEVDPSRRLQLAGDLQAALTRGEVFAVFQPLSRAGDLTVVGAEALARWRHPSLGLVPPDEFIAIAEQTGLIREVTGVILDQSLRQARRWADAGTPLRVSVNLSPRTLAEDGLCDTVEAALALHGLPPQALLLEVTESSLMSDLEQSLTALSLLRRSGIHIALDDFGTGHSSLTQLRTIPVDEVKLDRSFLTDLGEDRAARSIVAAAVTLCHELGKIVVAEGVEDQRTVEHLRSAGVDLLQGYHLGRPLPADEWLPLRRNAVTVVEQRREPGVGTTTGSRQSFGRASR